MSITRYVISSVQNDTEINEDFFSTLQSFCSKKKAELMLVPTKYLGGLEYATWDESVEPYMVNTERFIGKNIKVLGDLYLLSSIENPVYGFDVISKGKTVVLGHPQYQMKMLPVHTNSTPIMLTTTGAITSPNVNPNSKVGKKAIFNHSFSALYISVVNEGQKDEEFHIRNLNWDGIGFYDVDGYYSGSKFTKGVKLDAIVTGDEHVVEIDDDVVECTYGKKGIVSTLKPKTIIRGDVLDCISISHHNKGQVAKQNKFERSNKNDLEKELRDTCEFILKTTPKDSETWLVASNHNEHLDRWLEDPDSNLDKKNSRLYHWFMYQKTLESNSKIGAFELFMLKFYPESKNNVKFLDRDTSVKMHGIELGLHGDLSSGGQRGSLKAFSKLSSKVIVGHSHTPGIDKGAYQVGTSSKLKLEYTRGLSSWNHTHCLIYPNGKRQLINIVNKKWFV